ncbi:MAG: sigma-70 family RNA polymerase sigma factor [Caldilineaceae bacterium]
MSLQDLKFVAPWPPTALLPNLQMFQRETPELLHLFRSGTAAERADAFSAIYNRYCQPIWDYIYAQVDGAEAEAKDIFGQIWLIALEELARFEYRADVAAEDPLRSWLFRCASNRVKQFYREKHARVPLDLVESFLLAKLGGEDTTLYELFAPGVKVRANQLLYSATRQLTTEQRLILRLRYHSGMTFAEIGDYLEKSEGAVKVQHHRLLKKLRTLLETE